MVKFEDNNFQDPYFDQDSGCLYNLFNVKDQKQLDKLEVNFSTLRSWNLEETSFKKTFDLQHLKAIHKYLFQDVYEWAGEIRHVNLSKGETFFLPCSFIERGTEVTFTELKRENYLKGLDMDNFSKRTGYYLGEINHIHPFREGNGRTQREFINQLAHHNGYHIEWKHTNQRQMVDASIEANKGQTNLITTIIRENLTDRDRVLAMDQSKTYGGANAKIGWAEKGKKYKGAVIGFTERYIVQALKDSSNRVIIHNRCSLSSPIAPDVNKDIEISYPHGTIGLVRELETSKEKNFSKNHSLEKNSHENERER